MPSDAKLSLIIWNNRRMEVSFASNSSDESVLPDSSWRKITGLTRPVSLEKLPSNNLKWPQTPAMKYGNYFSLLIYVCNHILEQKKLITSYLRAFLFPENIFKIFKIE